MWRYGRVIKKSMGVDDMEERNEEVGAEKEGEGNVGRGWERRAG